MLEGVLAGILNKFLASYVDNLNTSQLNVAIWNGDVKLRNLRLKRSALDRLRLPIDVKEGYLGQLTMTIPWSNLKGKPVRMFIENVSLLAVPRDASMPVDEEEEEERRQALKQEQLARSELLYSGSPKSGEEAQKTESFMSSLFTRIIDNVQVTVRNIHIRYEDSLSCPEHPFALGVTLAELSAVSTDGEWVPTFVHNSAQGIHKLARLDSLGIYWNTDAEFLQYDSPQDLQDKLNELIPSKSHTPPHQYVLMPVSGVGKFVMRRQATKEEPKIDAQLVFDQLGLIFDNEQYTDGLNMVNLFSLYARQAQYQKFRSTAEELENNKPMALFRFAGRAILNEVHQRRRVWTWAYMEQRRNERLEYVKLFKEMERKTPGGAMDPTVIASNKELAQLERKLNFRDIRFYRSIARRELRKERCEASDSAAPTEDQAAKPAADANSSGGGWLGWLWGSNNDAKNVQNGLNKEERKELYNTIDWDEHTGQSLMGPLDDLPPDVVCMHATAKLNHGFLKLHDHQSDRTIMSLMYDGLQGELTQRPHNFETSVTLFALSVEDDTNVETQFREIVHVREQSENDASTPLFFLQYEHKPLDGRADNALQLRLRSMEIVYHASYMEAILRFFKPPETELELIGALLDVASSTIEGLQRETRAGLENALENHKTIDVSIDVQSPIWVVPTHITNRDGVVAVLDAGHLAMRSLLAEPKTMEMIRAKHFRQYTSDDFRQLEELMYDRYFIKLEDVQLVLGHGYDACMQSLQVLHEREYHLLERINLSFTLHNSILPRAPNLTKVKLTGNLPSLEVHFSDNKYRMILEVVSAAIPRSDKSAQPRNANQNTRRKMLADQIMGDDTLLLDDSDEGSKEGSKTGSIAGSNSDSDDEHAAAEYQDAQTPDVLSVQQKIFEFDLVVDQLSGTVSKSGATPKEDQLLAEAVFQHFRLGVYVLEHRLQVDVHLGSLDLVDCVVQDHPPMFRHMITSRPLEEMKGHAETPESEAYDLIFVQYQQVNPSAPDFYDKYEGIQSSTTVNLSTLNLMITRVTVLTVYDWILQTFVGNDERPEETDMAIDDVSELHETPQEEDVESEMDVDDKASETSPSAPSKTRVKVKLSSINLRLNDDGTLLSTLTLSTADAALLLRGSTMRLAARVGSLSLLDEIDRERADPSFANLLSIEGEELVDFAFETFDPQDAQYPGYETSIWLRSNTLQLLFVPEAYADLLGFFAKLAKMKAVYDAAKTAASAQASQLQNSRGLTRYDVLVKTPIVVLPHDLRTRSHITAHLGELYAHNGFVTKDGICSSTLDAGLRQIRLKSFLTRNDDDDVHELTMLDDINLSCRLTENMPLGVNDEGEHTQQFSAHMSDINVKLTQQQYILIMSLIRGISVLASADTDVSPEDVPGGEMATDKSLQSSPNAKSPTESPAQGTPPSALSKMDGQFALEKVRLDLYDETAVDHASLENAGLFCFMVEGTQLKMHQHPETGTELEIDIRTFSITDTSKSRETYFREIFPATPHDCTQLMVNYTISPLPARQTLIVVTVDSPKLIFSLEPLLALVAFFTAGMEQPESSNGDASAKESLNAVTHKSASPPVPSTASGPPLGKTQPAPTSALQPVSESGESQAPDTTGSAPGSEGAPASPSLSLRINVVEPRIILLSSPTKPDSQAVVLLVRQIVLSHQTVMVLTVTQMGMFVWRMNAPNDRQRLLNNVDMSLTMDAQMTPNGKITSIEIDVGRLFLRMTRSDIELFMSVINNALALTKKNETASQQRRSSTSTVVHQPQAKSHAPSVLNKIAEPMLNDGQVLFSREELTVRCAGIRCIIISEVHMLPFVDAGVNSFALQMNDWSADMRMKAQLDFSLNNFNLSTSNWEPLVEPWTLNVVYERNLAPESSTFTLSSGKRLEINVAAQFVDTTTNMLTYLDKDNRIKEEARHMAPFRIRNRTGYRLSVYSEAPIESTGSRHTAHFLDNGHDMPWTFGDMRTIREHATDTTYNQLSVHIEDMPWERLRHIAVNHEGEYMMTLRPKLNQVSHRLLCEVKLENNIKVVTFQSTFRIDNRSLIPFEVGMLDDQGNVMPDVLRIEPETYSALPIINAYDRKIRVRPDPGLGYSWSTEAVGWQDLLATASHVFVCPAEDDGEAPFQFQAFTIHDTQHMMRRNYPRLTLALRAPVEIENLLPYDIHYRLFDKNLNLNWASFLRRGGVSPVHVVQLQHLLLLSIELEDSVYSPSEFAIIASDNPDDFQVENTLLLADESNLKLELRMHYHTYPNSGGAFKVQIYAPYIFLNLSRLPVTIKSRPWAGHSRMVAGQDASEKDYDASEPCKPFLLSRLRESNNRFMIHTRDSAWSKPLSFDVIGSEVGVSILSASGDRELYLGLDVQDGLGKFKLSKVIKLAPRYLILNELSHDILVAEHNGGDPIKVAAGERVPLHWLHVASDKHATLKLNQPDAQWTAPFSLDNIGNVFVRVVQKNAPQRLVQVDVQVQGPTVFVRLLPNDNAWPFVLRNETEHSVIFMQTSAQHESQRSSRDADPKRYVLKPRSKMKYAWDYPADADKYIRLQINGSERVINILEIGALLPFKFAARDNLPAGVVSLDVRADETSQTLVISDYTESKSHFKLLHEANRDTSFKTIDVDTSILFAFNIELAGVGISIISSRVQEVAYITFRGLELSYSESQVTTAVNVICKWIQIDNQTPHSIFPIVLYPTVVPKDGKELDVHPTLQASVIRKKDESYGVRHIKYASVLLQELTAELDEDFLFAMYDFVRATSVKTEREYDETVYIEHPHELPEPPAQATSSDQVYIEILHLQPIALNLSFMSTDHNEVDDTESSRTLFFYVFNVLTMVLGNVNEAPVRLNALVIENVRLSKTVLLSRVAYHYGQGVLFQVHRILGSADFLGNPVGLFNNVSSGVADMFYEPYYGLIMHGNRELGYGIARGASNFVKKTVFGVTDSVSKMTGSISKGLAAVTMDRDFQTRWRAKYFRNKPKHALYGITVGANSFLTSVASGIEGLALRPLEGAEDGGASGFIEGLGRGLIGAVTKPAAGAFDMASSITEGLRNTTQVFDQSVIDRVRLPRFIASDHVIRPYSEREALGRMWLQTIDNGRLARDQYVAHINTPGPNGGSTIMLTESRICTFLTTSYDEY